ncbi:MAG: hypothetical protein ACODAC_09740 [Pseudomonadota bacterium]
MSDIERRFRENDIPLRLLYPWWYRLGRRLGLDLRPPVTYTSAEHLLYGAAWALAVVLAAAPILVLLGTEVEALVTLTLILLAVVPATSWLRYRAIRRRIGLDQQ